LRSFFSALTKEKHINTLFWYGKHGNILILQVCFAILFQDECVFQIVCISGAILILSNGKNRETMTPPFPCNAL